MIKKFLRFLVILIVLIIGIGIITYLYVDESLPDGTQGEMAEQLADEMLVALNKPGFDTLKYISFTFRGVHTHHWDLENNQVTVEWEENEVFVDLSRSSTDYDLLEFKAYQYFINDSFWLVAPFKVRDEGVLRSTVDLEDGRGLLLTYTSGGVTPGDSYLWILDERGFPKAWKLWTSNVPIGGLEFSWENWEEQQGVWLSTLHQSQLLSIDISELEVR